MVGGGDEPGTGKQGGVNGSWEGLWGVTVSAAGGSQELGLGHVFVQSDEAIVISGNGQFFQCWPAR